MKKGIFITLEGPEGAGKSLQMNLLSRELEAAGINPLLTREPGGTGIADAVRSLLLDPANAEMFPLTELLLYGAARAQHVRERIAPALAAGRMVICDRFTDSTTAYQGYGRGLEMDLIETLNGLAAQGVKPDLTILLDIDPVQGLERVRKFRAGGDERSDRMENEDIGFHRRVRDGFLALAATEPGRFRVVDAAAPITEVTRAALQEIMSLLSRSRWSG